MLDNTATVPPDDAARPFGRSLSDFQLAGGGGAVRLYPAETRLLEAVRKGETLILASVRPDIPAEHNRLRAGFVRFLALGGDTDTPVHEKGVRVSGAFIEGELDLDHAECLHPIRLTVCHIGGRLLAANAALVEIHLDGSHCRGAVFDDATVRGNVYLRDGFESHGEVRFTGAQIEGDLNLSGACLRNPGADALACRRIRVRRTVYLSDGFHAEGRVRFSGAEIGGELACYGGHFVHRQAAPQASPNDRPQADYALSLANAKIDEVLWLGPWPAPPSNRHVTIEGSLDLQGARVATLVDHEQSWPVREIETADGRRLPCVIALDGFVYGALALSAPTLATTRRRWLLQQEAQRADGEFKPQPFEQLSKVLRDMGLGDDARTVGMLKEKLLQPMRIRRLARWSRPLAVVLDYVWGGLCGYGYRPSRLFVLLVLLLAASASFFQVVERHGAFAPRDPEIWTNAEIVESCAHTRWTICPAVADLIPFNAVIYAADTIIPVMDFGQRSTWTPVLRPLAIKTRWGGEFRLPAGTVHVIVWFVGMIGAAAVVMLGAIMAGFIKRE